MSLNPIQMVHNTSLTTNTTKIFDNSKSTADTHYIVKNIILCNRDTINGTSVDLYVTDASSVLDTHKYLSNFYIPPGDTVFIELSMVLKKESIWAKAGNSNLINVHISGIEVE